MRRKINPTEMGNGVGISSAAGIPTQDQGEHFGRVYERLSRTPFATLVNALRSGTRQDQLSCMLQVERRLLQYRQVALCVIVKTCSDSLFTIGQTNCLNKS